MDALIVECMFRAKGKASLIGEKARVSRISGGRKESEGDASKPVARITAATSSIIDGLDSSLI